MTTFRDHIVPFTPAHGAAWKDLNTGWLAEGGFALEAKDHLTLDDPQGQILAKGGRICTKSELLRAGIQLLLKVPAADAKALVEALPVVPKGKSAK